MNTSKRLADALRKAREADVEKAREDERLKKYPLKCSPEKGVMCRRFMYAVPDYGDFAGKPQKTGIMQALGLDVKGGRFVSRPVFKHFSRPKTNITLNFCPWCGTALAFEETPKRAAKASNSR